MIFEMPHLTPPSSQLSFIQRIYPYLILGIAFTLGLGLMVLLFIVIIIGAFIGSIYYIIHVIFQRYRRTQNLSPANSTQKSSQSRIIEHDDLD